MEYRKDLDGLRAISVIFVVLYHLQIESLNKIFSGGFIGVDIFFVLSGYLISGLLVKNFNEKKSIKSFYLKRSRRLLPSLYLIILFSTILSYFYLISNYYEEFYNSVIASSSFVSNFFFEANTNYSDTPYFLKPLLHTWSLSVEFQFIIFYPILLYFCLKKLNQKKIFFLLSFLAALNLIYVQFGGNLQFNYPFLEKNLQFFNPPKAGTFFYTTSRIWEFLMGAMCFFISKKLNINKLYYIGILLIFFSLYFFSKEINNPSINNIIPVIGCCLVIISNGENNFVKKFLSFKIIVFIGLISYSLYLVHFPIISFSNYIISDELSIHKSFIKIFIFIFSFLMSVLLWKYVEKPFRNPRKISNKIFITFLATIFSFVILSNYTINTLKKADETLVKSKYKYINFDLDKDNIDEFDNEFNKSKSLKILVLGDSHSVDLFKVLAQNDRLKNEYQFAYFDTLFEFYFLSENTSLAKKYREKLINSKKFNASDVIIISTDYSQQDLRSFDRSINYLKKFEKKIIISNSFPNFSISDPILSILMKNKNIILSNEVISQRLFNYIKNEIIKNNKFINEKINKNDLILFDRTNLICNFEKKICPALTNKDELVFSDSSHLTNDGEKYFSNSEYIEKFFYKNIKK